MGKSGEFRQPNSGIERRLTALVFCRGWIIAVSSPMVCVDEGFRVGDGGKVRQLSLDWELFGLWKRRIVLTFASMVLLCVV